MASSQGRRPRAVIFGLAGAALTADERTLFAAADPLGFILFQRNCAAPDQVRALVNDLRAVVGRADAPVLIDQEGGRVQRLRPPLAPNYPAAVKFTPLFEADPEMGLETVRLAAQAIGSDLRALGITVDCLPVLDLALPETHSVIGDRAYSADPETVIRMGRAAAEGLLAAGVLPVIKHIPGHGRARADSHLELPVVATPLEELSATDFVPFKGLADMPLAMTAHVVYTALDPDNPATLSPRIIAEIIRGHMGFDGALMSDDVSMKALSGTFRDRTRAAIAAGCDLVLHCNGEFAEMAEVAAAVPPLGGDALRRCRAAEAAIAVPAPFARDAAIAELETRMGRFA